MSKVCCTRVVAEKLTSTSVNPALFFHVTKRVEVFLLDLNAFQPRTRLFFLHFFSTVLELFLREIRDVVS